MPAARPTIPIRWQSSPVQNIPLGDGFKDHCEDELNRYKEKKVDETKREVLKPEFAMLNHCALTIVLQDAACTIMDPTSVGMGKGRWGGAGDGLP